ncbi:hypothetical protein SRHO_G00322040 [Serrasalmus rhombeus]
MRLIQHEAKLIHGGAKDRRKTRIGFRRTGLGGGRDAVGYTRVRELQPHLRLEESKSLTVWPQDDGRRSRHTFIVLLSILVELKYNCGVVTDEPGRTRRNSLLNVSLGSAVPSCVRITLFMLVDGSVERIKVPLGEAAR